MLIWNLINCVLDVLLCFTCLRAHVLGGLACLRAHVFGMLTYMLTCLLACLPCLLRSNVLQLTCLRTWFACLSYLLYISIFKFQNYFIGKFAYANTFSIFFFTFWYQRRNSYIFFYAVIINEIMLRVFLSNTNIRFYNNYVINIWARQLLYNNLGVDTGRFGRRYTDFGDI